MFCHIIGYPLNKPRSVPLWKNFFNKKKLKISMSELEIEPKNFNLKIKQLLKNKFFLASAITMPYKKKIVSKINFGNKISKYSNSINLIIKNKNNLIGYNTDVVGAILSVKKIKKKNIMIFGLGGTGKAILKVFSNLYKNSNFICISSKKQKELGKKIIIKKKIYKEDIENIDLFINCSPLGSNLSKKYISLSPLNEELIKSTKSKLTIFDIVYKPKVTKLNKLSKKYKRNYFNGLNMNTIQANEALRLVQKFYKKI